MENGRTKAEQNLSNADSDVFTIQWRGKAALHMQAKPAASRPLRRYTRRIQPADASADRKRYRSQTSWLEITSDQGASGRMGAGTAHHTACRTPESVNRLLGGAIVPTVQLVLDATLIAIALGVLVGIVSALRQYTTFDYAITFVSFVLYSLPVFWVAVLLKQFLAIGVNDFLNNPTVNWFWISVFSVVAGLFWAGALGGEFRRSLVIFGIATAVTFATSAFILGSGWLMHPSLGVVGVGVIGAAIADAVTAVFAGMSNKLAL